MLIHNKDTFIVPVAPGDEAIFLQNIQGSVTFEIKPYSITAMFVDSNMVKVKSKASDKVIAIHFLSNGEAIIALSRLQAAVNQLKDQVPNVSEDIINYIDLRFLELEESETPALVFRQETASCEWFINISDPNITKKMSVTVTNDLLEEIEVGVKYEGINIRVFSNQPITGWVFG